MFFKEDNTLDKIEEFQKNKEMLNPKEHNLKSYEKYINNKNREQEDKEQLKRVETKHTERKERLNKIEEIKEELLKKYKTDNTKKQKISDEELEEKIKARKIKNNKTKEIFETKKELSEKDKLYKLIRQIIVGILIAIGLSSLLELYFINKAVDEATPMINNMNEITNDMMKANKKVMEKLTKELDKY